MDNTRASTATANAESTVLVLGDKAEVYSLVPQEVLEQVRSLVGLRTLGSVTTVTPNCSQMPPPSQPA